MTKYYHFYEIPKPPKTKARRRNIAPARDGVSWESHLFGLLVGGGLAWLV